MMTRSALSLRLPGPASARPWVTLALVAMLGGCGGESPPPAPLDGAATALDGGMDPGTDASVEADAAVDPDAAMATDAAVDPDAGTSDCPQASTFLDVRGGSAGASYPSPTLAARCEGDFVIVDSNGIIGYTFVPMTPNPLTAQTYSWRLPRRPVAAAATTAVPLVGTTGIAVNGMPLYGPTEAPMMGSSDPFLDGILDYCNGHTAPGGVYHYHAPPECLFTDYEGQTHLVVGYAFDGFPILAPFECTDAACTTTRELHSSYVERAGYRTTITNSWDGHQYQAGHGDLDECNGKTLPSGEYVYYATREFPYFMGCFRGTPQANSGSGTGGGMMMGGGGGALPMCTPGMTMMCCGDGVCGGPETAANCAADCG
jgi:hypothetical protein